MGQTARTTTLLLDLSPRAQGGTNTRKRHALEATVALLNRARRFYLDFFLAHPDKLQEQVEVTSSQTGIVTNQLISADKLLTWAESHTVATETHPEPLPAWNFSHRFPDFPSRYRRSVIKDCIGKARGYLTALEHWEHSGNQKGKPGRPTAANHPTLYAGTFTLELERLDLRQSFVQLNVYTATEWVWATYPTRYNRFFERRRSEEGWEQESPQLVLRPESAAIHFLQTRTITERQGGGAQARPRSGHGGGRPQRQAAGGDHRPAARAGDPDALCLRSRARSAPLSPSQTDCQEAMAVGQTGQGRAEQSTAVGAHPPQNLDTAHKTARAIARVCARYPGCVLLFERLRVIKARGGSKSRRRNRKQANQLRGKIN